RRQYEHSPRETTMSTRDAADEDSETPNAEQQLVAVDENDDSEGIVERLDAHTGDGVRHRAFTAMLFDEMGNLLLAQRSPEKRLWDTGWDGTVASHPREGEEQLDATRKRLEEELGVT